LSPPTTAGEVAALLRGSKLLIFDFDGTLADSSPLHAEAFAAVLGPLGLKVDYKTIAGLKTRDALGRVLGAAGHTVPQEELDAMAKAKQHRARELISERLQPLPGVDSFLRWSRPRFRLGICSSGSCGTVGMALEKLGYQGWFEPLVCAEDVVRAKPDPEGFLKVLSLAAVPAEHALVFEDSEAGLKAARQAGLQAVDVRVISFEDLDRCVATRTDGKSG
jgi:sugar-phosphatase